MRISDDLVAKIRSHGEHTYPEECCGILLGSGAGDVAIVQDVVEIDNSQDENRRRRFFVTPEQYRKSEELADSRGLVLLGFYHTHPDHPAAPSDFDLNHALPWFTYVIMSVVRGQGGDVTAWLLRDDRSQFDQTTFVVERATASLATRTAR